MDYVVQLSQSRRRDTVTIQQVVTSGHHQGFGQDDSIKDGGTDGSPLGHKLLYVGSDLFPTGGSAVRAVNPHAQDTQRRPVREDVGPVETRGNILMGTGGPVCQRTDHQYVSFVQVEFTPNSKTRVSHNPSHEGEVLSSRHEQVHIVGVHKQFSRGQAAARNASNMLPHTHTERLDTEVVQNGGQGVSLPEAHVQRIRCTQTTVDPNSSAAVGSNILNQGDEIVRDTHGQQNLQKPGDISFIVGLGLVQADYVTIGVSRIREVRHLGSQPRMVSNQSTGYKTGLVRVNLGDSPRANPAVNQVSVHFAICVHRRDRA